MVTPEQFRLRGQVCAAQEKPDSTIYYYLEGLKNSEQHNNIGYVVKFCNDISYTFAGINQAVLSSSIALAYLSGFLGMYIIYEVTHYRFHIRKPVAKPFILLRKHHFYHHFHNPKSNFRILETIVWGYPFYNFYYKYFLSKINPDKQWGNSPKKTALLLNLAFYLLLLDDLFKNKQKGIFKSRSVNDIALNRILSVNYEVSGMMETLLGFGTIIVQTFAGDFILKNVPHPAENHQKIATIVKESGVDLNEDPQEALAA